MNEHLTPPSEDELLSAVRSEQNEIEERYHDGFLADNLIHSHITVRAEFNAQRSKIERQFLDAKKGKNMGERLELVLQEPFLGVIKVVELGVVTHPTPEHDDAGLKQDYLNLYRWMIQHGWTEQELPREKSGRWLDARVSEKHPERTIIGRNRPLISTRIDHNLEKDKAIPVNINVAKRMVFSIPTPLFIAIQRRFDDPNLQKEETITYIEQMLINQSKDIDSIRTAYYLMTELV